FDIDEMDFDRVKREFGRLSTSLDGYAINKVDFYKIAVSKDGKKLYDFQSPLGGDRIYSMTLLPGGRAVFGASFGMYLVDLKANRIIRNYRAHTSIITGVCPAPDGKSFLSGSLDQTICLWDANKEEPLVSLFVAGRDWIAWTPQGHYACSPQGEML